MGYEAEGKLKIDVIGVPFEDPIIVPSQENETFDVSLKIIPPLPKPQVSYTIVKSKCGFKGIKTVSIFIGLSQLQSFVTIKLIL